jgi:hypothetical protein
MAPPKNLKELQSLTGRLATLNKFIVKPRDQFTLFHMYFETLKHSTLSGEDGFCPCGCGEKVEALFSSSSRGGCTVYQGGGAAAPPGF